MNTDKNIKNTEVTKVIKDVTKKTTFEDYLPTEINDKVQLTADINPNLNREITFIANVNSFGSTYTTPNTPEKITYITSIIATSYDSGGVGGDNVTLQFDKLGIGMSMYHALNTAYAMTITFPGKGLKVPPNCAISSTPNGANGEFNLFGYVQDNNLYTQNSGASS